MIETYDIADALALEMRLLTQAAADPTQIHVKFWQSGQSLVSPRKLAVRPEFPRAEAVMSEMGWPVVTRATGGDVTPQGPGIINVSLIYVPDNPPKIDTTYDTICAPMERVLGAEATRGWNPGAFCDGAYNVQWRGKKFAGTAQRFKRCKGTNRSAVLGHALMLMQPPSEDAITALNTFLDILKEPRRIERDCHTGLPDGRSIEDFVKELHTEYLSEIERKRPA